MTNPKTSVPYTYYLAKCSSQNRLLLLLCLLFNFFIYININSKQRRWAHIFSFCVIYYSYKRKFSKNRLNYGFHLNVRIHTLDCHESAKLYDTQSKPEITWRRLTTQRIHHLFSCRRLRLFAPRSPGTCFFSDGSITLRQIIVRRHARTSAAWPQSNCVQCGSPASGNECWGWGRAARIYFVNENENETVR